VPCTLESSPLITPDRDRFNTPGMGPGSVALDAPVACAGRPGWLLNYFGRDFVCLAFGPLAAPKMPPGLRLLVVGVDFEDCATLVGSRYDGAPGTTYLIRPDQHIAARWRAFDLAEIIAAWHRSLAMTNHSINPD
jgi:3-(3-hydroxy-phenyl)propionate hydroxylase